jgi:undecaprenyl-diphosphatase
MFEIQYFLIGIIQGVTEFLPISSSGHLVLFAKLTSWEDQGLFTDIAVHFGTLFAVILYMRKDILYLISSILKFEIPKNKIVIKIMIATLPAIIIGFFIYDFVIFYFRNIKLMATSSIVFAVILYFADRVVSDSKKWENISFKESFIIGMWQVTAFIPGASRAGVTITGARFLNFDRYNAMKFSMLLSIPIILASLSLSLINLYSSEATMINLYPSFFASFIAFISALLSINFMMKLIQVTNLNIFIIYRILLGIFIFLFV